MIQGINKEQTGVNWTFGTRYNNRQNMDFTEVFSNILNKIEKNSSEDISARQLWRPQHTAKGNNKTDFFSCALTEAEAAQNYKKLIESGKKDITDADIMKCMTSVQKGSLELVLLANNKNITKPNFIRENLKVLASNNGILEQSSATDLKELCRKLYSLVS